MIHNEDSRVKIPSLLHLMRLGHTYLPPKGQSWDESTNVFRNIFNEIIQRINPDLAQKDIEREYQQINLCLENEDLGRPFYNKLVARDGVRSTFENLDNNDFHVVTELPCRKDDEEFRLDVT